MKTLKLWTFRDGEARVSVIASTLERAAKKIIDAGIVREVMFESMVEYERETQFKLIESVDNINNTLTHLLHTVKLMNLQSYK